MKELKDQIATEIVRRLKRTLNSKSTNVSVSLTDPEHVGHWKTLQLCGRISLSNRSQSFYFDFRFSGRDAHEFLESCDLEVPKPPANPKEGM